MRIILAVGALLISNIACAAGLGYLNLISILDEPLIARIDIIGKIEPNTTVEIGNSDDFAKANLEMSPYLDGAQVKIIKINNKSYINITTQNNFNEPVLNLILKLKYNEQTIQKSYTKFIELHKSSKVNTAKLIDNNSNPIAGAIDDNDKNIVNDIENKNDANIQMFSNQKIDSDNSDNTANNEEKIQQYGDDEITHTGTTYINKKNSSKQLSSNKNNKLKTISKPKNIKIAIKSESMPNQATENIFSFTSNNKNTTPTTIPKIVISNENKPTLKLDSPSAAAIFASNSVINISADNPFGLGINNNSSLTASNLDTSFNVSPAINNPNASSSILSKNITKDKNNSNNIANNKNIPQIGFFDILKTQIITTVKNPLFSIIIIIVFLLLLAIGYILYIKKSYNKNLKITQQQLNLLQEQLETNLTKNNDNVFNNEELIKYDTIQTKRRKKRKTFVQ